MKRLLLVLSVFGLALVPAATPGSAGANPGAAHTFAVGGGFVSCETPGCAFAGSGDAVHFAFSAHQEVGLSTSPKGHVVLWFVDTETGEKTARLSGPVTCLATAPTLDGHGGLAGVAFRVEKSTNAAVPPGSGFLFQVIDGGEGGAPDFWGGATISAEPRETCRATTSIPLSPVTKGNIVVALQSPAVATPLSGSWYSIGSDGSLSILSETGWEVMQ